MLAIALAWLHLIALGLGLGAVIQRGTALRRFPAPGALGRAFAADTMWGFAAGLWISTGLWRLLAGTDKATGYYMQNHVFFGKMGLLLVILALEVGPMVTLIRWRAALRKGAAEDAVASPATARRIATVSHVQAAIVVLMVLAAVSMARGLGYRG